MLFVNTSINLPGSSSRFVCFTVKQNVFKILLTLLTSQKISIKLEKCEASESIAKVCVLCKVVPSLRSRS